MNKYYSLKEVKSIRDEISKLGERSFPLLEAEQNRAVAEWKGAKVERDKTEVKWDEAKAEWREKVAEFKRAGAELEKAMAQRDKSMAEWHKVKAEWDKVGAELNKAKVKYDKAKAEYSKAEAEWDIKLFTLLIQICPEAHYRDWLGYLAIPRNEDEDWIIPLFTGDYDGDYDDIEHKAFSIWTKPKGSCDEREAREVVDDAEKHR